MSRSQVGRWWSENWGWSSFSRNRGKIINHQNAKLRTKVQYYQIKDEDERWEEVIDRNPVDSMDVEWRQTHFLEEGGSIKILFFMGQEKEIIYGGFDGFDGKVQDVESDH